MECSQDGVQGDMIKFTWAGLIQSPDNLTEAAAVVAEATVKASEVVADETGTEAATDPSMMKLKTVSVSRWRRTWQWPSVDSLQRPTALCDAAPMMRSLLIIELCLFPLWNC